jgi:hypothetical protein
MSLLIEHLRCLRFPDFAAKMVQTEVLMNQYLVGPIQQSVRAAVREGEELVTPIAGRPFRIGRISNEGIVLELGAWRTPTLFRWEHLEGIVPFLTDRGDVQINDSTRNTSRIPDTLDGYLKGHINRPTAAWVAVLLEKARVARIVRTRPARIRLR